MNRAKREEKQKQQGEKVVKWIFYGLIVLAIIYMIYSFSVIS